MSSVDKVMFVHLKVEGRVHKVERELLANWAYFDAVLSGNWGEQANELTITTDEFVEWRKLVECDGVVAYSSVAHVVDFFLPKDDSYLLRLYTDDQMTQEQRMTHYRRVGRTVKLSRARYSYNNTMKTGVHSNFFLWTKAAHSHTSGTCDSVLQITGIVHDAWLRCRVEGILLASDEEIPWWLLRWDDIALVNEPNVLVGSKSTTRLTIDQGIIVNALYPSARVCRSSDDKNTMILYMERVGQETKITTGYKTSDRQLPRLFSILFDGYLQMDDDYLSHLTYPLLEVNKPSSIINRYRSTRVRPYQLLMMTMSNLWYRGRTIYVSGNEMDGNMVKVAPLHSDEIESVVKYGLSTLGADFMLKLSELVIKQGTAWGEEADDSNPLARAVTFAETVQALAADQPMARLP